MTDAVDATAVVATTVGVMGAGAGLMASFAPSWFEIRSMDHAAVVSHRTAIRHGYSAAAALTLAQGVASAALVRNALPLLGAVFICAVEVAGYEWWIRHPSREDHGPTPSWARALSWGAAGGSGGD